MRKMRKMKAKRRISFSGSSFSPVGLRGTAAGSRLLTPGSGGFGRGDDYIVDSNHYKLTLIIILVILAGCIAYSGLK